MIVEKLYINSFPIYRIEHDKHIEYRLFEDSVNGNVIMINKGEHDKYNEKYNLIQVYSHINEISKKEFTMVSRIHNVVEIEELYYKKEI